ncbi:MAG: PEP/pyruvate-binding domain-containing protein, partial [Actinomycetota bacterium]
MTVALTSTDGAASAAPVIDLDEPGAADAQVAGAKAANLAKAVSLGLPVLPGFVVTTGAGVQLDDTLRGDLRRAWNRLSSGGRKPLVVRSSSAVEDGATGSMAGVFKSILDVRGWDDFLQAFSLVLASASTAAAAGLSDAPMAVLVQPQLDAVRGGVMFGADPLSGRTDRVLVVAVDGGPEPLVSGRVGGARHVLSLRTGRVVERNGDPGPALRRAERRALVALARVTAEVFGGPQDIEWAFGLDGRLWLLQSRPITAMAAARTTAGPVLGPGPVAETFPEPLAPLESDLWLTPLRAALIEA